MDSLSDGEKHRDKRLPIGCISYLVKKFVGSNIYLFRTQLHYENTLNLYRLPDIAYPPRLHEKVQPHFKDRRKMAQNSKYACNTRNYFFWEGLCPKPPGDNENFPNRLAHLLGFCFLKFCFLLLNSRKFFRRHRHQTPEYLRCFY